MSKFEFTRKETISDVTIDLTPPTLAMPPDKSVPQAGPDSTEVYFHTIVSDDLSGTNDRPLKNAGDCIQYVNTGK